MMSDSFSILKYFERRSKRLVALIVPIHFLNTLKYFYHFGIVRLWTFKDVYFFIHLPKCAGGSIKRYLIEQNVPTLILGHALNHVGYKFPYKRLNKHDPRAFCVVRNPFDRIASAYFFLKKGGKHKNDAQIFNLHLSQYSDFHDFVISGLGNPERVPMLISLMHLIPQTTYIVDDEGDLCVTSGNILRFENLAEDFSRYILSRGRQPVKLLWENRTDSGLRYIDLFKREDGTIHQQMVDIIVNVYHRDFDVLGYSKELHGLEE